MAEKKPIENPAEKTYSIEYVETLEQKAKLLDDIDKAVGEFYDEDYTGEGNLCDIGEVCARKLGYL